jgi:SpoVK/Ycf46/Vps4 family AAA+-type ATPase
MSAKNVNLRQLKALLKCYLEGDDAAFFSLILRAAEREAAGQEKSVRELKEMILKAKTARLPSLESAGESSKRLVDISRPKIHLDELSLTHALKMRLARLIDQQRHIVGLQERGVRVPRKLLLLGPAKSGKTLTAMAFAGELDAPLFQVRLNRLAAETEKDKTARLRRLFKAIAEMRGIYLFDDIGAVVKPWEDAGNASENARLAHTFFELLKQDDSSSVFILTAAPDTTSEGDLSACVDEIILCAAS